VLDRGGSGKKTALSWSGRGKDRGEDWGYFCRGFTRKLSNGSDYLPGVKGDSIEQQKRGVDLKMRVKRDVTFLLGIRNSG